jgi:hypothetical protein
VLTRRVIDTNALQSPDLRAYLAADRQHMAVLTEYAGIEVQKGDTLKSIFRALEILSDYPEQVLILKGTQTLCGLRNGRERGLAGRLIDERATADFANYCNQLKKVQTGDLRLQAQIHQRGRDATAIADRILSAVPDITDARRQVANDYTEAEKRILRTHGVITKELGQKLLRNVAVLAALLFRNHPRVTEWPDVDTVCNRYLFRYALCAHLWLLDWISDGSNESRDPTRVRNDMIDLHFATCATYFDGLISSDAKTIRVHREAIRHLALMTRS